MAHYNIPQDILGTKTSKGLQWGEVKGLEFRAIPILEPWELSPGGDLRHFVVDGINFWGDFPYQVFFYIYCVVLIVAYIYIHVYIYIYICIYCIVNFHFFLGAQQPLEGSETRHPAVLGGTW